MEGVLSFAGLLLLAVGGWRGIQAVLRRVGPNEEPVPPGWGIVEVLWGVGFFAAGSILAAGLLHRLDLQPKILNAVLLQTAGEATLAAWIAFLAVRARSAKSLGLLPQGGGRSAAAAPLLYVLFLPTLLVSARVWSEALRFAGQDLGPQSILAALEDVEPEVFGTLVAYMVAIGPFFEELGFRGFLQPVLQKKLGLGAGAVLTALLFTLVHEPVAWGPVFALGLFFGYLYRRTSSLWAVFLAHALHNGLFTAAWVGWPELREAMGN